MTAHQPLSAADADVQSYLSARDARPQDLLVHAARKTGKSPLRIQRDFHRVHAAAGRLNMMEYIRTGLYLREALTREEIDSYISNDQHWPVAHACNDRNWAGAAEDKAAAATLLSAAGVPVPHTVAAIDSSARLYPGVPTVSDPETLRTVLADVPPGGLFCKVATGMVSFGAIRILAADNTHVTCAGHDPLPYEAFFDEFVGDRPYLLQHRLDNHAAIAPFASALATVRMVNLVRKADVHVPVAVLKLPQGDNIADAFWRPGNLAAAVAAETGKVLTVAERVGFDTMFHEDHPQVAGLKGMTLPFWDQLLEMNECAARVFAPIAYQSTDIAITPDGPVVVEINYGGGFDLPQYATGQGLLTAEMRRFLDEHGVTLGQSSPPRKGLPKRRGLLRGIIGRR